jgi:hypothetical protein
MDLDDLPLHDALIGAAEAPPDRRIEFRDPIARHGERGIRAVEPWLSHQELFRFAVRVILRAGQLGTKTEAIAALKRSIVPTQSAEARSEVDWAVGELGGRRDPPEAGHVPARPRR